MASHSGRVFSILLNILNDLGSLGKYNWGSVVYEYLVMSLFSASFLLRDQGNAKYFHVDDCVYLLHVYDNVGGSGADIGSPGDTHCNSYHLGAYFVDEDDEGRKRNEDIE